MLAAGAGNRSDRSQCAAWRAHVADRQHYRRGRRRYGRAASAPRSAWRPATRSSRAALRRASALRSACGAAILRILVGCGAAAGIAGAFGAPLAGAFYGFELIIGSYSPNSLAPVGIAALIGFLVARPACSGRPRHRRARQNHDRQPRSRHCRDAWPVRGGARHLPDAGRRPMRITVRAPGLRPTLRTLVGGFVVGLLAIVSPQVMSSGSWRPAHRRHARSVASARHHCLRAQDRGLDCFAGLRLPRRAVLFFPSDRGARRSPVAVALTMICRRSISIPTPTR